MNRPKGNIWFGVIFNGQTYWRMQASQAKKLAEDLNTDLFNNGKIATAFNAYTGEIL